MENTIHLYRTISWEEFYVLLKDREVKGSFNREHKHTTYQNSLGNVVCCFRDCRTYIEGAGSITIQITVSNDEIVGEGIGIYESYDPYDNMLERIVLKETYLTKYAFEQVKIIAYTAKDNEFLIDAQRVIGEYIKYEDLPGFVFVINSFREQGLELLFQYDERGNDVLEHKIIYDTTTQCICEQVA